MTPFIEQVVAALEGSYAVEREIGSGGAATVFLARDLKHHRPVAVKVLKPTVAAALGADRFLREIDIAAHLNHPHILPLYDSGEADGLLYYVTPFIEGESLKERLDREGPIPVREAVGIAREVAAALEHAHRAGVVHRDIKPGNILLSSGEAVVADFGIAHMLGAAAEGRITQVGTTPGTLAYMSPEQAAGETLDGRSDVYSLGCVLYEMLSGVPPFVGANAQIVLARQAAPPARLTTLRDTVTDALEAVVLRALARLPADRFASAAELSEALDPFATGTAPVRPVARPGAPSRRVLRVAAVVVPVAAVMLVIFARTSRGVDFAERDWIVIADVENGTGDPVFDLSLNTAMTVAVSQSRYVNVYPRARVQEALRRMGRGPDAALDVALAREVAVRENLKAVLAFGITGIDSTYVLSTRVVDPVSDVAVESQTVRAEGKSAVLPAVDELARRLRESLGESLRSIRQRSVPLPQATTSSLEALRLFADGARAWDASRWTEARSLWERAVALDPDFAWAHASLGLAAQWLEEPDSARLHFDRAEALLDRVTEKERLWIRSLIRSGQGSVDALRTYTQQWPDDRDAWYNLGNGLRALNRTEEGLEAYRRAIGVDSTCWWCYVNSAMALQELGRFADSGDAFEHAFALEPGGRTQVMGDLNRNYGFVRVAMGDTAGARALFEEVLSMDGDHRANGLRSLALLDMYRGRIGDGIEKMREAVGLTVSLQEPLSEYRNRLYLASLYDIGGRPGPASRERALARGIAEDIAPASSWLLILGQQYARVGDLDGAAAVLGLIETQVDSSSPETNRADRLQMRGELALARGDTAAAESALETANGLWSRPTRLESLAFAAYRRGRWDEAERLYREYLDYPLLGYEQQAFWIRSLHRMGRVLEERGDTAGAMDHYGRFLALWRDGDADLPEKLQVEERVAALGGG